MNPFDDETTQKYSDAMEQLKQMNSPKFGGHTNRINQAKKRHQDSLKAAEIEAKTIEEIWQPEFQNTLTRFYKKYNKDLTNATPRERVEYMYQDRIFAEHNTIGMGTDTAKVYFSDDESKSDFAKITKTYSNLPYFGRKTIGFGKWLKDFAPAFILDPINIAGGFIYKQALKKAGQELSEEIAKGTVKNLTEKQFNKEIQKKATLQAAKGEGILGASVSGYQDITQQMSEKEVGLTDEYDVKRTLIATAAGGALGYSAGYGISKIGGVVTKKQAKEMYNNAQGLKKSVDEDFGVFETPENLKTEKPVETQTKTEETVSESVIRNEDINVEKIRKTIRKEEEKLKRSTPLINVKNITPKKDGKNLEKIAQSAADSGKLRTETRKGLYEEIRKEAKSFLTPLNYKIFNSNLEVIEKISPDLAPTILAQNYNMRDANEKLMMIDKQIKKGSDAEQERLMPELLAAFINAERQLVKHQKIMEGISDALQTPKMANEITEAQRLRLEVRAYQQEAMSKLVADLGSMSSKEKLRAMQKMNELLGNPYIMKDFLNKAKRQNKQTRTSFSEALQEYSTANLLFDPTTHETNLLSGYLTFQLDIIKDFFTGVIMGVTNRQQARGQLNMALDLFASQAHFFNLAWKKAKLSFKANQIVGDSIETTYDGSKFRAMDSYVQQLRESKNLSARIIGKGLSPLAQFAYQSLRVLGAGDAAIKAMINRSQRVANVNQRMRTAFPDIIKQRKQNAKARKAIKNQENINDIKQQKQLKEAQLINPNKKGKKNSDARKKWQQFEDKKLKELKKFDVKISELRKKQKNLTPYEEKWAELYFQYEDEFGNFRNTASFSEEDIMVKGFDGEYVNTLDDLTKSVDRKSVV